MCIFQFHPFRNAIFSPGDQKSSLGSVLCGGLEGDRSLTLSLRSCRISEPHIKATKHHFASIEWDGLERVDEESDECGDNE